MENIKKCLSHEKDLVKQRNDELIRMKEIIEENKSNQDLNVRQKKSQIGTSAKMQH